MESNRANKQVVLSQNRRYGTKLIVGWIQSEPKNSGADRPRSRGGSIPALHGSPAARGAIDLSRCWIFGRRCRHATETTPEIHILLELRRRVRSLLLAAGAGIGEAAASGEEEATRWGGEIEGSSFPSSHKPRVGLLSSRLVFFPSSAAWASSPSCCRPSSRLVFFFCG